MSQPLTPGSASTSVQPFFPKEWSKVGVKEWSIVGVKEWSKVGVKVWSIVGVKDVALRIIT